MVFIRILFVALAINITVLMAADKSNKIVVNTDLGTEKINKNIYGHFAEHLGACIYGGGFGGEKNLIQKNHGIRKGGI
jgi:alpha-L-arabinofuranosidase